MSDTVDDRDPPPIAPHPNQRRSACERCRRQKLKCSRQNAANQSRCQRCARLGFECVGGRQRKVGRPSRSDVAAAAAAAAAATAPSATVLILNAAKSSKKGPPSSSSTRVWKNASTHVSDSGFKSTSTSNAPSSNNSTPEPRTVKLAARPARSVKVSEPSAMNGPARSSGVPFTIAEQPRIGSDSFNAALANVDNLFQSFNEQDNRFPKTCAHQLPGNVAPLLDMSHADNQQSTADVSNDFNLAAEALALHESIDIAWPLDTNAYQNAQAFQPQPQQQQQQLDEDHQTHHTYYQHQYTQQRNQSLSKAQPRTRGPNSRPQSSFFPFPTPFYQYPSFNNRNSRDYPLEPLVAGPTAMVPVPKSTSPKSNSFLDVLDNLSAINTSFQRCVYLIKKHGEALNVAILIANKPPFAMNGISVMNRGVFNLKELLRLLISLQNSLSSSTEDSQSGDPQPQSARMKLPVPHPSCIKMPFPSPVLDGIQRVVQEASSSSSETATNTPKVLDTPTSLAMISCYSQGLFFLETTVAHINRALADPDARPLYNLANERYGGVPFHEHLMRGVVFAQLLMNVIERLDDLMGIPPRTLAFSP